MKFFEINGFTWDSSPLNLPKPEPKHIQKARKRRLGTKQAASSTKSAPKKKQKVVAALSKSADEDTASESEGEDNPLVV